MQILTEREQQAYNFIVQYFKDNGFSPSYQEIAEGIYYGSATSVSPIIQKLKDKGYIELPLKATARAIKVVGMEHAMGQEIPIPEGATNGDMLTALFGENALITLDTHNYLKGWWNAPYKGDN